MSGHYYYDNDGTNIDDPNNDEGESQFIVSNYGLPATTYTSNLPYTLSGYVSQPSMAQQPQYRMSIDAQQILRSQPQYTPVARTPPPPQQQSSWVYSTTSTQQQSFPVSLQPQSTAPVYPYAQWSAQSTSAFPQYIDPMSSVLQQPAFAGPSTAYLSPPLVGSSRPRVHRTSSAASHTSSVGYNTDNSRGESPDAAEMAKWGNRNLDGTWSCSYSGCISASRFLRGCDLRKHYKRHAKTLFCRYQGCQQSTKGGFSSKKDRLRHEAKHNPSVPCEWEGCMRTFSRVDNMKDHVRRVHLKHSS